MFVRDRDDFAFDPEDPRSAYVVTWADSDDPGRRLVRMSWAAVPAIDTLASREHFDGGIPSSVAVDRDDADIVYVGTSLGTLYRSDDHARTWQRVLSAGWIGQIHACAGTVVSVQVSDSSFYRSEDSAQTWHAVGPLEGRRLVLFPVDVHDPDVIFAKAKTQYEDHVNVLQSSDGGRSWHALLDGAMTGGQIGPVAVDPSNPRAVAVGVHANLSGHVLVTEDGGQHWSRIRPVAQRPARDRAAVPGLRRPGPPVHDDARGPALPAAPAGLDVGGAGVLGARQAAGAVRAGERSTADPGGDRENRELRQANAILRKTSAYSAQAELDRRSDVCVDA